MSVRGTHGPGRRERLAHATAAELGVRVFHGVRCARCKAGLHDRDGNPRWEVVGKLDFVCMGGCKTVRRGNG